MATSIQPPETVVVTGANGFIAQHCVAVLLSQGYHVIGTVRTQAKAAAVVKTHGSHPHLQTAVVGDITLSDAYLEQLQDLAPAAILHLAAPFSYATTNFEQDLMIPAVKGTMALLEAARQIKSVRRVVQTNSFACIYDADAGPAPEKTYSARDWSPLSYEDGVKAPNAPTAYRASKTAAEKAAWDFIKTARPQFDLVSLCPAMVFGAFLPGAKPGSTRDLNTSNALVQAVVSVGESSPVPPTKGPVWVDVRDVADAHLQSLLKPEAAGGRYLLAAGVYCNQEIADVTRKAFPKLRSRVPAGEPGKREAQTHFKIDATDAEKTLGLKWRGLGECLGELVPQLYEIEKGQ